MIIIAAFIFGLIMLGFTLLTLLPLGLLVLSVGVYMEGRTHPTVADQRTVKEAKENDIPQAHSVVRVVQHA